MIIIIKLYSILFYSILNFYYKMLDRIGYKAPTAFLQSYKRVQIWQQDIGVAVPAIGGPSVDR